jgi:hypothetical protein
VVVVSAVYTLTRACCKGSFLAFAVLVVERGQSIWLA